MNTYAENAKLEDHYEQAKHRSRMLETCIPIYDAAMQFGALVSLAAESTNRDFIFLAGGKDLRRFPNAYHHRANRDMEKCPDCNSACVPCDCEWLGMDS